MVNERLDLYLCFLGSLPVLVNGCSTEDIGIQKDIKKRDLFAPFLFPLVVGDLMLL